MSGYRAIRDATAKAEAGLGTLREAIKLSRDREKSSDLMAFRSKLIAEREVAKARVEALNREVIEVTRLIADRL